MPRRPAGSRARAVVGPALAATVVAAALLPLPASAAPLEPTALLAGELLLAADAHRAHHDDVADAAHDEHADDLLAAVRLTGGLVVPVDAHDVEGTTAGSRVTVEVPVPDAVVDAVETGRRVDVPDVGAPAAADGSAATERVVVLPQALEDAAGAPAPVRSDLAGAAAVALATADQPSEARVVAASEPRRVAATGAPKKVTAVVVTHQGRTDSRYTDAEVARIIGAGSDFWADQSGGSMTYAQEGATVRYASSIGCDKPFDLWTEAAQRAGFTQGADRYLVLFLPSGPGCAYGLGTIGGGPSSGGYSYVSDTSWPALAHEWGHNMSLLHADRGVCGTAQDATSCTEQPYGDLADVMSSTSTPAAAGNASAYALGRLGLLAADDRVAVTKAGVTSVTLAPLSAYAGVRSATVVDPRSKVTYYLENRQSSGRDTYGWAGRSGQTFGLRVLKAGTGAKSLVLDATPTSGGRDPDVVVAPGTTFVSAGGGVQVRTRLGRDGAVVASVSVAPAGATHWATGPFTTTVAPTAVASAPVDRAVTLTGKVTGTPGRVPTGTVTATSPAGATASGPVRADGTFAVVWTPTVLGRATVRLTYAPDDDAFVTSSKDLAVPVVAPTTTTATSPSGAVAAGAVVTLPVEVAATGRSLVPAGTVTVAEGTRKLATATLSGGSAAPRLPVLVGGRHDLTVTFAPATPSTGPTTAASTTTATVTVAPAASKVVASLPAADVATTENGRVAVTVTAPGGVTPAGTVTVREGSTSLATATLVSGRATVTLPRLPVGFHDLVVAYGGETRALASESAAVRLEVTSLPRSRVTAAVAKATTAQQPVVTVRVSSTLGPSTGGVTVSRGDVVLGTGTLSRGTASVTLPRQPAGSGPLVVTHDGGGSTEGGSATAQLVVAPARPTVTATLSTTTKRTSETATVSVVVASPAGTPTGTVELRSGSAVLARTTLADGAATLTVPSTLPAGKRSLTVVYGGSTQLTAATSATQTITVTA
ncbi:Ig-like domain-containing protein [Pseudokineococcus lusitanus]|uniref:Ig-like domain-containing protein n=1 Tax=Pseudokineococcus lusitanus TaxID=763993 RepID=A0A3N1GWH8_9ACTN|nr:Ig-like domain-containing protein [Pseudokineococcus lusitanus]ROP34589.1 Ig-like domain-containing protein [Pseudokineococcus lusitanus]